MAVGSSLQILWKIPRAKGEERKKGGKMDASSLKFFTTHEPSLRKPSTWRCNSLKHVKLFRVIASSSQDSGDEGAPPLSRRQTYSLLKQQMSVAAKSEDYKEAARIRDSLRSFEEEEPILRLRRMLKKAISDERFEDAAKLRDELQLLTPSALLKCSSDATTLGSRSKSGVFILKDELLRRHWILTDARGKTEHVWGMGVIGEQPVIHPRKSFEYSSACPLGTSSGKMEGEFEMRHVDKVNTKNFTVKVAPFALSIHDYDSDEF